MNKELRFEEVPHWWALCLNSDCPMRGNCLRHHAATLAPPTLAAHMVIISHDAGGANCPYFVENQTVRLACGFKNIFNRVNHEHHKAMRRAIMEYLGSATSKGTIALKREPSLWAAISVIMPIKMPTAKTTPSITARAQRSTPPRRRTANMSC